MAGSGPSPRAIASVTLFVISACAIVLAFARFGTWNFEPLRLDLELHERTPVARTFEVDLRGPYVVNLILDRIPGQTTPWATHEERWRPVDLTWRVRANGRQVATGNSRDYPWNHIGGADFDGQTVGSFMAGPGAIYELSFSVNSADPRVGRFNPKISVSSDNRREPFHSRFFIFPALFSIGVLTAVVGAALLVVPVVWRWLTQRPRHAV